jgi:hypothetical protein
MKAENSFGILVRICDTTWHHNPENKVDLCHGFESLSSWVLPALPSLVTHSDSGENILETVT